MALDNNSLLFMSCLHLFNVEFSPSFEQTIILVSKKSLNSLQMR